MQETWVRFLNQEDLLEKGMAAHSVILARRIPWTEEPGRLQTMGLQRVGHNWATDTFTSFHNRVYFIAYFKDLNIIAILYFTLDTLQIFLFPQVFAVLTFYY